MLAPPGRAAHHARWQRRLFRNLVSGISPLGNRFGTIVIRDNCFISDNAILLAGIEIESGSAVGAGSVVTKTVPSRTIVAGNPKGPSRLEHMESYLQRMILLEATGRDTLRQELTLKLWRHKW